MTLGQLIADRRESAGMSLQDLADACGATMKYLIVLIALSGCTHIQYEGRFGKVSRTAFGTDLTVKHLSVDADPNGHTIMTLDNTESIQSKGLEQAAKGAAEGAVKGFKP